MPLPRSAPHHGLLGSGPIGLGGGEPGILGSGGMPPLGMAGDAPGCLILRPLVGCGAALGATALALAAALSLTDFTTPAAKAATGPAGVTLAAPMAVSLARWAPVRP